MFFTLGNLTININHIYLIWWRNKTVKKPSNNRFFNWFIEGSNNENQPDHVTIYFNFSISDSDVSDSVKKVPFQIQISWEDEEEELKALAKAVNFDLTKIGR